MKKELNKALRSLINKFGSEQNLSRESGVTQANINKIKNDNVDFGSIRIGTLQKLFPDMKIDYFGTGEQQGYVGQIAKLLNRLTDDEQKQIHDAIIACFPHVIDSDIKNTIEKIDEE